MDRSVTLDLDDRHVEYWRDSFCEQTLAADAPWSRGQRLALRLDLAQLREMVSLDTHVVTGGPSIRRTAQRIAREDGPLMLGLSLVTSGGAEIAVDGGTHELGPGDLCLLDSAHPFEKRMGTDYREVFLYCPIADAAMKHVPPRTRVVRGGALPGLLADTLLSVRRHAATLADDNWPPLIDAVIGLTRAVFANPTTDDVRPAAAALWRGRVLRYLDDHLGDPALSPPAIARALRISPRYLHRLFEDTDATVAALILARRLDRCRAALLDPAHHARSISELAFDLGFNSAPHFSRTFRARFGISARELRASSGMS